METGRYSERLIRLIRLHGVTSSCQSKFYRLLRWFKVIISPRVDEDGEKSYFIQTLINNLYSTNYSVRLHVTYKH